MKDIHILKRCLATITRVSPNVRTVDLGYRIYNYTDEHGNFDYQQYVNAQKRANREKCDRVWVVEENVAFLANYIRTHIPEPRFGICHGTRRGNEQTWFRQRLRCDVIGTEIADSAHDFPHTVRWDFHDDNPEWTNRADFVYSNSFDHSYDPGSSGNRVDRGVSGRHRRGRDQDRRGESRWRCGSACGYESRALSISASARPR